MNPQAKRFTAAYVINLPGSVTLDERDDLIEHLRGLGGAWLSDSGRTIACQWSEKDEWALRGLVEQAIEECHANFPSITFADRELGDLWRRWQGEAEPFA